MTQTSLDELGPVDYTIVEFPVRASNFTGEMTKELVALVDSGSIRVIDVLILTKDQDGSVEAMELSESAELGEPQKLETELAELLAADESRTWPVPHPYLEVLKMIPAELRRRPCTSEIPPTVTEHDYDLVVIGSPT